MLKPFVMLQITYYDMFKRKSFKYFGISGKSLPQKEQNKSGKKKVPRKLGCYDLGPYDWSDLGYSGLH